jgi:hypothetical protein
MTDILHLLLPPPSKRSKNLTPKATSKVSPLRFSYMHHPLPKDLDRSLNLKPLKKKPKNLPPLNYETFLNQNIQLKYKELQALFKKP